MFHISEKIVLTLWVGSMWTAGYVVAPLLFKTLERSIAGSVAGQMFTAISVIGLICAALLLAGMFYQDGTASLRRWQTLLLIAMLLIILVGQFVLQPMMASLKAQGLTGEQAVQFARLHGVSSVLFLFNSLGGLALVSFGLRPQVT